MTFPRLGVWVEVFRLGRRRWGTLRGVDGLGMRFRQVYLGRICVDVTELPCRVAPAQMRSQKPTGTPRTGRARRS